MRRYTNRRNRKAVAPVLATLLMIAVAVAMSVIIFMWSQGFLSQTSQSTGSQQGAQNQAAQSSIAIEAATFSPVISGTATAASTTVIVRNVGAVAISIGSITVTGISSNAGYRGTISALADTDGAWPAITTNATASSGDWYISSTPVSVASLAKGSAVTIVIAGSSLGAGGTADTSIKSGDTMTFKITTTAGTFAQATYTVP